VGFAVDNTALGQVFSEYYGVPCQAFHRLLHTYHHPSSSGSAAASIIVKSVPLRPKDEVVWTGLIWLGIGTSEELFAGKFLSTYTTGGFSRRAQLHEVC
jgi:hypothetical protein